jgi:hypothetical protein
MAEADIEKRITDEIERLRRAEKDLAEAKERLRKDRDVSGSVNDSGFVSPFNPF